MKQLKKLSLFNLGKLGTTLSDAIQKTILAGSGNPEDFCTFFSNSYMARKLGSTDRDMAYYASAYGYQYGMSNVDSGNITGQNAQNMVYMEFDAQHLSTSTQMRTALSSGVMVTTMFQAGSVPKPDGAPGETIPLMHNVVLECYEPGANGAEGSYFYWDEQNQVSGWLQESKLMFSGSSYMEAVYGLQQFN